MQQSLRRKSLSAAHISWLYPYCGLSAAAVTRRRNGGNAASGANRFPWCMAFHACLELLISKAALHIYRISSCLKLEINVMILLMPRPIAQRVAISSSRKTILVYTGLLLSCCIVVGFYNAMYFLTISRIVF